jgi:GGDEF domain-containing protein
VSDEILDPHLAERLTRAAHAAQALSETLWEALQEELAGPRPERVAELSEQLGEVAAVVASLARVDSRAREEPRGPTRGEPARPDDIGTPAEEVSGASASAAFVERESCARESRVARARNEEPSGSSGRTPVEQPAASPWEPPEPEMPRVPAVLVDELAAAESPPRSSSRAETTPVPFPARVAPPFAGAPPARPAAGTRPREGDPPRKARPEIEIRDERSAEGPSAWIDSIGRRLERHEQDRAPFAALLVELVDLERLRHAEPAEELARLTSLLEDALAHVLRPADSLTRERPGRYWLLAPQTDGPGARVLIERIARAVRSSVSHRGTPLEVAVGVATCPEDGRSASELAAHADVGLYAARAAGRSSIG